jgi:hypothetical protein
MISFELKSNSQKAVFLLAAYAATACTLRKKEGPSKAPSPQINLPQQADKDISSYAELCRQELGLVGVNISPMNCLDGVEIPLLIDGKPPSEDQYKLLAGGKLGCDTPSWLNEAGCINYNFVLHRAITADVDLALVCRSRHFTSLKDRRARERDYQASSSVADFKALYYFDSLGLILSHKKTGKTCFFDQVETVYGGFIPFPDRRTPPSLEELPEPRPTREISRNPEIKASVLEVTPAKTWKKPYQTAALDRCTTCHDSGPWKHTPWLPPEITIPSNPKGVPMIAIGPVFEDWRVTFEPTAISTDPVNVIGKLEPQVCTSCHRIGRESTCKSMIDFASGIKDPGQMSPRGLEVHRRRWMPPQSEAERALTDSDFIKEWDAKYKPHYDALRRCCDHPKEAGCRMEPFGR